jgi:hypothetical protein
MLCAYQSLKNLFYNYKYLFPLEDKMKKTILIFILMLGFLMLSACGAENAVRSADITGFIFEKDDVVGYTAIAAQLSTEDGEDIVVYFKDIKPQKVIIKGSLEIRAGSGGVIVFPSEGYSLTFIMDKDIKVIFEIGSNINVYETKDGIWVPEIT